MILLSGSTSKAVHGSMDFIQEPPAIACRLVVLWCHVYQDSSLYINPRSAGPRNDP